MTSLANTQNPIILAVDDDPVMLKFLVSILKEHYRVRPFTSGVEALEYLKIHTANLMLVDYKMPEMSGVEVLRTMKKTPHTRDIPVITLTGSISNEIEAKAFEAGAVDYIVKPIYPNTLLIRVKLQLELQAHRQQLELLVEDRTKSLNAAFSKLKAREEITLSMLARATDLRDHDTGGHIERTTAFVKIMVEDVLDKPWLGYNLSHEEADDIIRSSKLHDLGKIAIPDNILQKPDKLSNEEFDIIKTHSQLGEQFLNEFVRKMEDSFLESARDIAYSHHEKWDGTGYPLGLKGKEIPLSGRIVAIADVYDALTSERPYKKPLEHDQAKAIIVSGAGKHFDPYLVKVFERNENAFASVSEADVDYKEATA